MNDGYIVGLMFLASRMMTAIFLVLNRFLLHITSTWLYKISESPKIYFKWCDTIAFPPHFFPLNLFFLQKHIVLVLVFSFLLCPTLCHPMDCSPPGPSVHGDFSGKSTGVGCHALLQVIFWTQESNQGLLHCRQILYQLSYQGSPCKQITLFLFLF